MNRPKKVNFVGHISQNTTRYGAIFNFIIFKYKTSMPENFQLYVKFRITNIFLLLLQIVFSCRKILLWLVWLKSSVILTQLYYCISAYLESPVFVDKKGNNKMASPIYLRLIIKVRYGEVYESEPNRIWVFLFYMHASSPLSMLLSR